MKNKSYIIITILLSSFFFNSCEKGTVNNGPTGPTVLTVRLASEIDSEAYTFDKTSSTTLVGAKKASANTTSDTDEADKVQTFVVPFDKYTNVIATLEPVNSENTDEQSGKLAGINKRAAIERTPLSSNVKYKILAYLNNVLVGEQEFVYGSEASTVSTIQIDGGKKYTFVAYSINSTGALPEVTNKQNLLQASINNESGDLMYFIKKDMDIVSGNNNLDVVLKHQYSQITTSVAVGQLGGKIEGIGQATISGSRTDGNIKLSDGVLSYNSNTTAKSLTFPSVPANAKTLVAAPVLLISPATITATFSLSSITINGATNAISFSDLKINPYKKYNLKLAFNSPCTEAVGGEGTGKVSYNLSNGQSQTFTAPAADYGFVFDVTELDNSFNLKIGTQVLVQKQVTGNVERMLQTRSGSNWSNSWNNWRSMTNTSEGGTGYLNSDLEFQSSAEGVQNIRFADGSRWEADGINGIWTITGTQANPTIRIVIAANGAVTFFGSKSSGGSLHALEVLPTVNGVTKTTYIYTSQTSRYAYRATNNGSYTIQSQVNPITWSTTGNNTVEASQFVIGATKMVGFGSGRKIIPCP